MLRPNMEQPWRRRRLPAFTPSPGERFGRLTILRTGIRGEDDNGSERFLCQCDCGAVVERGAKEIKRGTTRSCGCLHRDTAQRRGAMNTIGRHGFTKGGKKDPTYGCWSAMMARCSGSPSQSSTTYAHRGIKVCDRWKTFENFLADMGPRPSLKHSIDRVDNNGDYEPANCRWADHFQQARNRPRSGKNDARYTHDGRDLTITEWSKVSGIPDYVIRFRISKGWDVSRAVTEPVNAQKRNLKARAKYESQN